nr:V protein [Respirovirus bovis]
MEDNAQNNQIMDSWEERSGDKSSDISSALDIIEFILSTDPQESAVSDNENGAGVTRLSTTIHRPDPKSTKTGEENSGPTNEDRQLGTSYKCTAETKDRVVNQEAIQGRNRRGSSSDSRTETMVIRRITRGSSDPDTGTEIQENLDYNETREVDKNPTKGKVRQLENVPVKVPRSDAIPPAKSDGNSDDGGSLESISTPNPRHTSLVTTATPDDEEELLSKNKRSKRHQLTNQRDNKEIKKGGRGGDLEARRYRPSVIQIGPRTRLQRIEEEPEDPQDQHRCRGTNKNTEWVPKEENHILEHPQQQEQQSRGTDSQKSPTISTRTEANNGIRQISSRTTSQSTEDERRGKKGHRREHSIYRKGDYIITESWCNPICSKIRPVPRQESCMCGECPKQCRYCIEDRFFSGSDDWSIDGSGQQT